MTVPSARAARPRGATRPRVAREVAGRSWLESALVTGGAALVAVALVVVSTRGLPFAALACAAAAYLLAAVVLGAERLAVITLMGAMAVAPMYLGISPTDSTTVTPPDLLLFVGVCLLLPTLATRRLRLPMIYVVGIAVMLLSGFVAAFVSSSPIFGLIGIIQWLVTMAAFSIVLAIWRPGAPVVVALAWSYVLGHLVSTAGGVATGHSAEGRWYGLTHHPNAYAEAGMMAFALALFLFHHHRGVGPRLLVVLAGLASAGTVVASGGRAATVVVAVLVVMIPVVERSALSGFVLALLGALGLVLLPIVAGITGEQSALGRLTDIGDVAGADQARNEVRQSAMDRFADHPLIGNGTVNLELFTIHDTYLQVGVGLGIFGIVGFLLYLFPLSRPLFESGPYRRLCYTTWAFIGFAWTTPGMLDRSLWIPMSLAILAALPPLDPDPDPAPQEA